MGLTILFFAVLGIQIALSIIAVLLLRDIRNALYKIIRRWFK